MTIMKEQIDTLLRNEDIEGILNLGAPDNEYHEEARLITDAVAQLDDDNIKAENVEAIIASIWANRFDLSAADIARRQTGFQNLARKLIALKR